MKKAVDFSSHLRSCSKKGSATCLFFGIFFTFGSLLSAQVPVISNLSLDASSSQNLTNDQLISTFSIGPSVVETATAWYRDGSPECLLYLPFEGGSTNALFDFSGSNNDASTTGVPTEEPTWNSTGGYNGSGVFTFDGDDYLLAGSILPLNSDYTKTAWINVSGSDTRNIMSSDFYDVNNHFLMVNSAGYLSAGHRYATSSVEDGTVLTPGQWYFVAVTFDYSNGEMTLYKDGVQVDRAYIPETYRSVADANVQIGAMRSSWAWQGSIDEPKIYNRELSAQQIQSLFTNGNNTVVPQETAGNEEWHVVVTPFSASQVGSSYTSNTLDILAAYISGFSLDASSSGDLTIDNLIASYSTSASVVETASAWYRNGTSLNLLYLPFEGGFSNALRDFSGNGNDASVTGDISEEPTWDATGGHNGSGAFTFDGDDYLLAGDVLPLNAPYTKTAWIKAEGTGHRNIMSSILYDNNNHTFKVDDNGYLKAGHRFAIETVIDGTPLNLGQWYFVAVTFDYESGEMILYKDGVEVDRGIVPVEFRSVADPSVLIGAFRYSWNWLGSIDEPRVYGHILSPEQILSLFSTGNDLIVPQETSGADEWRVRVTPFSVSDIGTSRLSNRVTIHDVVVSDISNQTIQEGTTFSSIDLDDYVTSYEYATNELEWTFTGSSDLIVAIDPVTHIATITPPDNNWYGSEDISFTATNPTTDSDFTEVSFTVQNVNDPPVVTVIGGQSTDEDITLEGLTVTFSDLDPTDSHTIDVVSSNPNVSMANLSGNTSGSTYHLVPALNWNGNTQITVTVTDQGTGALSDSETYTLVVNPINDAPVISPVGNQSTDEDIPLTGLSVNFTDPETSDAHSITVISDNSNVTVENLSGDASGSTYNLVPVADWNGFAQITVTVTDDGTGALNDMETYTLTVDPINDAPVIAQIGDQSTFEDNALEGLIVTYADPDALDTHTISVVSLESNVAVVGPGGNASGSTYDLVPTANWTGTAQITVSVTENGPGGLSDTEIYALTVGAINDAPVLSSIGNQTIDEDNSQTGLAVVFTDEDATDEHIITVVSSEADVIVANLIGNVSGSTYDLVPNADWNGSAMITVTVTDDGTGALFDTETYTLTVNPINDAPTYINLTNNAIDEGVAVGTIVGVLSSTDVDIADIHTYEFVFEGGDEEIDNQFFSIVGDELRVHSEMDYELKNTFDLLVKSNDGNGGSLTQQIPVTVNNIVEVSIEENEGLSFKVYPVPAVDRITVEVDNPENKELLFEIYSNSGALVYSEHTVHGNTIDLSSFSKGMYILKIQGNNILETRKIIVGDR